MKAILNGTVIAESNQTINIEGNHYFPADSVNKEFLKSSATHTACHWKGTAFYYDISVNGQTIKDVAWYYPNPSDQAKPIKDYIAFRREVKVEK